MAQAWPGFPAPAVRIDILHNFSIGNEQGRTPIGMLIEANDGGDLCGTTTVGGRFNQGTVYRMKKDGTEFKTIHHFTKATPGHGAGPVTGLIDGRDGYFYGTTESGSQDAYYGIIYRIKPDGTAYETLRAFPVVPDGLRQPAAPLLLGGDGLLYAATRAGGAANFGALCVLTKDGSGFGVLHEFAGQPSEGTGPIAGLVETKQGMLLGVTSFGGQYNQGTLFKIGKDGSGFAVLHQFLAPTHGGGLYSSLTAGPDGVWYGIAAQGGRYGQGTVFKVRPEGDGFELLQHFSGQPMSGSNAKLGMTPFKDAFLVGVTTAGGGRGRGWIFAFDSKSNQLIPLYSFTGAPADGEAPSGPLLVGRDGACYGVTLSGGRHSYGTVYRIQISGL